MLGLTALFATACYGVKSDSNLAQRTGGTIAQDWKIDLPNHYDGWTVKASPQCVVLFAWSAANDEDNTSRTLRCHDPDSGALRWDRSILVSPGFVYDKVHIVRDQVVYQNNQLLMGIDLDSGDELWSFDPGGRIIGATEVREDLVIASLNHKVLAVLDGRSGKWRRGIDIPDHRFVGLATSSEGPVAIVVRRASGDEPTRVIAVKLDGEGGTAPSPPFAPLETLWVLEIDTPTFDMHVVANVLVGHLSEGEFWGVSVESGEVLYKLPRRAPSSADKNVSSELGDLDEMSHVQRTDLQQGRALPKDQILVMSSRQTLLSQGHRQGLALKLLEIQARAPRDFTRLWTVHLASLEYYRLQRDMPTIEAMFIAGGHFMQIIDTHKGKTLWSRSFTKESATWTSVATEGRGLYLVYGRQSTPRLEAHRMIPADP
jgi:hypothetical protein